MEYRGLFYNNLFVRFVIFVVKKLNIKDIKKWKSVRQKSPRS